MNAPISPKRHRTKPSYLNFIQSLDSFQSRENLSYNQCNTIRKQTEAHYNHFFSAYDQNDAMSPYLQWQKEHELNIETFEKIKVHRVESAKEKVHINVTINHLSDLLTIIEENPYSSQKEYNIDLYGLHKIKSELQDIHNMIGLEEMKTAILKQLLYFIQGFADDDMGGEYKHTILTGPPGTGKTELAKMMGAMYSKVGILKNNHFKKVTRTDLVAGYLGQTAIKTRKVIDECLGGVLFIDEAYSLQPNDMYAKECVDTLCEALSDHKKDLMVIIAGYQDDLKETFFKTNTGLSSRFIWRFNIDKYNADELHRIFVRMVEKQKWSLESTVKCKWFHDQLDVFLDNGRSMEQLFLLTKIAHSKRIFGKDAKLKRSLSLADLDEGCKMYKENMKTKPNNMLFGLYI
jgi:SpoVK/Ycf46/Vps4 family AAA+-type ATPase